MLESLPPSLAAAFEARDQTGFFEFSNVPLYLPRAEPQPICRSNSLLG